MSADWAASVWLMHGCGLRVGETLAVRCNIGRLCRGRADCAEIAVAPRLITPRGGRRHRLAACWQPRQDGAVTDQSTGGDTVWGALVFDSRRVGWRSLEVRRWRQYARVDTTLPADDDQLLTTLLGAGSALRFATGGAGTKGIVGPGTVSATPPGRPTRLRWRSGSPESLDHVSVRAPAVTMHLVAAELPGPHGRSPRLPDRLGQPTRCCRALCPVCFSLRGLVKLSCTPRPLESS
jgi:hypothetical protein